MAFVFFNSWKKSKEEEDFTACERLHEILISVSINNAYGTHTCIHFCIVYGCFGATMAELSKLGQRPYLCGAITASRCCSRAMNHTDTLRTWQIPLTQLELDSVSRALCITLSVTFHFFHCQCIPIMSKQEKWTSNVMPLRHSGMWVILIKLDAKALCLLYNDIKAVLTLPN